MKWLRNLLLIINSVIRLSQSFVHFPEFRQLSVNSNYSLNKIFFGAKGSTEGNRKWPKIRKGDPNLIRAKSLAKGRDPIISLNMNLDYLAKSGQIGAARRAEELLLRIENLYNEGYYDSRPGKYLLILGTALQSPLISNMNTHACLRYCFLQYCYECLCIKWFKRRLRFNSRSS